MAIEDLDFLLPYFFVSKGWYGISWQSTYERVAVTPLSGYCLIIVRVLPYNWQGTDLQLARCCHAIVKVPAVQ